MNAFSPFRLDLATIAKRAGRKRDVTLPPIVPTQAQADDLFRIFVQIPRVAAVRVRERILQAYTRALDLTLSKDASNPLEKSDVGIYDDIPEIERELDDLETELRRLVLQLTPLLRAWGVRVETWHRKKFVGAILTATQVSLETLIGPEDERETLETALNRMIDLITDLAREAKAKVADAVWRGFQARRAARVVAKEIQGAMEVSRARAQRIANHQLQVLSATLDRERQTSLGITDYVWRHSRKKNGREEHIARDGKVFKWAKPPADGPPGTLPNCGCKAQAHVVIE